MREPKNCPECRWVSVVDARGRRTFEMRWAAPAPVAAATQLTRAA